MDIVDRLLLEPDDHRNIGLVDPNLFRDAAAEITRLRSMQAHPAAGVAWTASDHDIPDQTGTIRTVTGLYVNLLDPSPASIEITDIAAGLTSTCRFGGQSRTYYSVAEHSMGVAAQLLRTTGEPELALAGLLHDAAEAYIGDMVRPLKHSGRLDAFRDIEANLQRAIEVRFDLPTLILDHPTVKQCDNDILPWEMAMFRDLGHRRPPVLGEVLGAFVASFRTLDLHARARREADQSGGGQ